MLLHLKVDPGKRLCKSLLLLKLLLMQMRQKLAQLRQREQQKL
jgi:hypothetical protein